MKTLVILTDFNFERLSGASWNRVLLYSRALKTRGYRINIFSSRYDYSKDMDRREAEAGIHLFSGTATEEKATFKDLKMREYWRFLQTVQPHVKEASGLRYLLYNSNLASVLCCLIFFRVFRKEKIFIEKNELATGIALNLERPGGWGIKNAIFWIFKTWKVGMGWLTDVMALFFSGIIAISTNMERLYGRWHKKVLLVPILIDPALSPASRPASNGHFKIGYFGWIGEHKDGVFSLISSVKSLAESYPEIELHLYGDPVPSLKRRFEKLIDNRHIYYHGNIASAAVPSKLTEFNLLSLVRPKNVQTSFGFSTKLGEYLLSGTPTLITDVSDNALYLQDGVSTFLMQAGTAIDGEALESKIRAILNDHKAELEIIGDRGRAVAIHNFVYKNYAAQLAGFFDGAPGIIEKQRLPQKHS